MPPDLATVIAAWPSLPDTMKARIMGMVEASIAFGAEVGTGKAPNSS